MKRRSFLKLIAASPLAGLLKKKSEIEALKKVPPEDILFCYGNGCYKRKEMPWTTTCSNSYFYYVNSDGLMNTIYVPALEDDSDIYAWTDGDPI